MTLRKITFDNGVKDIPQSAQTKPNSSDIKPNTIKNNSLPREQNKKNLTKQKIIYSIKTARFNIIKR